MASSPADIRHQDSAHRRGLVLGLTMAEIMVLILFILLLALGSILSERQKQIHDQARRLDQLSELEKLIHQIMQKESTSVSVKDIVQRIVREHRQTQQLQEQVNRLREYEAVGKALEDIIHEIRREGGKENAAAIIKRLADYEKLLQENNTLKAQLAQLTNQIKAAGRGNAYPSCWVGKNGNIESVFELVLSANGITIRKRNQSDHVSDPADLPVSQIRFDQELPLASFISEVQPIYQWSVKHDCRFYVVRYSTVESAPIPLINASGNYFYPDSSIQYRGDK